MEYPKNVSDIASYIEEVKCGFTLDGIARAIKFALTERELKLLIERLEV